MYNATKVQATANDAIYLIKKKKKFKQSIWPHGRQPDTQGTKALL